MSVRKFGGMVIIAVGLTIGLFMPLMTPDLRELQSLLAYWIELFVMVVLIIYGARMTN